MVNEEYEGSASYYSIAGNSICGHQQEYKGNKKRDLSMTVTKVLHPW